ncbi:MAG: hypothetical protein KDC98_01455 [Planctomycetes bacterium]|nr:hypothetical protein [Planctomycetota bacterium]
MTPTESSAGDAPTTPRQAEAVFGRALEPLLGRQLHRLRRRYLWHGVGFTLLLPGAAIALFFALDHTLRLPTAIRLLHAIALFALVAWCIGRHVLYPMSRRFAAIDIAQALERAFPELHQRLVSTVQLAGDRSGALRNQSSAMIDALVAETAEAARDLPFERFFDPRRTRRVLAAAAVITLTLGAGALAAPATARIFLLRHLGMAAEYPRQTYLSIDLPEDSPELQRLDQEGLTELLLPAGGELHVSVLAEGVVPKEVFLEITALASEGDTEAGGRRQKIGVRSLPMTPRPGDRFRYVFRKVTGAFEFHARGGDDEHGDRLVRVRTVRAPQVATIRAVIHPPAYTGVTSLEQTGGAIEALVGSDVELYATTTAAVQSATMVFLESGRRIELEPTTVQDDSGAAIAHRTRFHLQASDRYQIELIGGSGLRNPNPGTYPIAGQQDYAPVGRWLLPEEQNTLLLANALICVRVEARDDFGLLAVDLGVERNGAVVRTAAMLADPTAPAGGSTPSFRQRAILTELIDLATLLGDERSNAGAGGDGFSLALVVRDNCQPVTGSVELPRRIVQIVDPQQLAEAIAKRFRHLREEANSALDVQNDRRLRLQDLTAAESSKGTETAHVLSAIEVGQSRVQGSCERLHQGLMGAFDDHLWNRLETSENAAAVIEAYREFSSRLTSPLARDPEFYRELIARRAAGTIGAMESALDPILEMIAIADALVTVDAPLAARKLAELQVAPVGERAPLMQATLAQQQKIAAALQQLLYRLEEWNDYQDMVQEARALRDRQRDLRIRTEELRGKK